MLNVLIVLLATILLPLLLYYQSKEKHLYMLLFKTPLSMLFILAVLVQPHPIPAYYYYLLTGLVFCFGGDFFLALPQRKMFLLGLVSFLIGHLFYIPAFITVAQTNILTWIGTIMVIAISGGVYFWLRPHLGDMKVAVIFYVIVITIMVSCAFSLLGDSSLNRPGRIVAFAGAICFYFSDIFVARNRFVKKDFLNRLIGLPMYYTGQFLLAFSVGLLG